MPEKKWEKNSALANGMTDENPCGFIMPGRTLFIYSYCIQSFEGGVCYDNSFLPDSAPYFFS